MTRCEGLHRDRGYTPVRRCVGYVRVYIRVVHARLRGGGGEGGGGIGGSFLAAFFAP